MEVLKNIHPIIYILLIGGLVQLSKSFLKNNYPNIHNSEIWYYVPLYGFACIFLSSGLFFKVSPLLESIFLYTGILPLVIWGIYMFLSFYQSDTNIDLPKDTSKEQIIDSERVVNDSFSFEELYKIYMKYLDVLVDKNLVKDESALPRPKQEMLSILKKVYVYLRFFPEDVLLELFPSVDSKEAILELHIVNTMNLSVFQNKKNVADIPDIKKMMENINENENFGAFVESFGSVRDENNEIYDQMNLLKQEIDDLKGNDSDKDQIIDRIIKSIDKNS